MTSPYLGKVRVWSPTPEQAAFLQSVEGTRNFLHNLSDSILRQYAGQWIAAKDSKIIAAAVTREQLHELLGELDNSSVLKLRLETGVTIRCESQ